MKIQENGEKLIFLKFFALNEFCGKLRTKFDVIFGFSMKNYYRKMLYPGVDGCRQYFFRSNIDFLVE